MRKCQQTETVDCKTGDLPPLPSSLFLLHWGHSTNEVVCIGGGEKGGDAGGKDKVQERMDEERGQEGFANLVALKD